MFSDFFNNKQLPTPFFKRKIVFKAFLYKANYLKLGLVSVTFMLLTACGGGNNSSDTPQTQQPPAETVGEEPTDNEKVDLQVSIKSDVVAKIPKRQNEEYTVVIDGNSKPIDLENTTNLVIETKKDSLDVVGISNDMGEQVLVAWKHPEESSVELSADSNAVMFFLFRPQFYGVKFTDSRKVEDYIKSHADFPKLSEMLKNRLSKSYCPLDPSCSTEAMFFADEMYKKMDFTPYIKIETAQEGQ